MIQEQRPASRSGDLLPADGRESAAIPFDRRRARRSLAGDSVMASFISDAAGITLARAVVQDSSRAGAGLRCPLAIEPGSRFSLHRDGPPLCPGRGTVARCAPAADGFMLGLLFDKAGLAA